MMQIIFFDEQTFGKSDRKRIGAGSRVWMTDQREENQVWLYCQHGI